MMGTIFSLSTSTEPDGIRYDAREIVLHSYVVDADRNIFVYDEDSTHGTYVFV